VSEEHAAPPGGEGTLAKRHGGGDGEQARHDATPMHNQLRKVFLPRIQAHVSPGRARPAGASKVRQLLASFQRLDSVEKHTREFYAPQAGRCLSQIKGILNCQEQMDTWDMRRKHRYADVLMADKPRDHELEVFHNVRERRRETLLRESVDKPSLLPLALLPEERTQLRRPRPGRKKKDPIPGEAERSKSCEPLLETAHVAPKLAKKTLKQAAKFIMAVQTLVDFNHEIETQLRESSVGWLKRVDLKSGRYYYFNTLTGCSTWDPPPSFRSEHARYKHLQDRKRSEEEAQEEMLELQVLVDDHSELIETLRSLGSTDAYVDALMGSSGQKSMERDQALPASVNSTVVLAPLMKDVEDMASRAYLPGVSGNQSSNPIGDVSSSLLAPEPAMSDYEEEAPVLQHQLREPRKANASPIRHSLADEALPASSPAKHHTALRQESSSRSPQGSIVDTLFNASASARALNKAEALTRARFFVVKAENLPQLPHTRRLAALGTKLVVDVEKGSVSRLCDLLNSSQAATLVQRNYRVRRSRMIIQRKYRAEDNWRCA
jgi:hypothetical protein